MMMRYYLMLGDTPLCSLGDLLEASRLADRLTHDGQTVTVRAIQERTPRGHVVYVGRAKLNEHEEG